MAKEQLKIEELSKEQILDLADAQGRKLGFLLATSSLDDDVKAAIVGILDTATPGQLDILTNMLEEGYLSVKNETLNNFLKSELESIQAEYEDQKIELEANTLEKLDELTKKS
ncbi:MAG: hypothetical protein HZB99_02785 [Candidatus Harrisonbacteria bacterium]|nr:hypothetical protein [Candidatus Harrisonbacteria bacterium]